MDSLRYQQQIQELDKKMHHHLTHLLKVDFEHFHITDMQYQVLVCIYQQEGITMGELARALKQDAGNISNLCKKMERLAYVQRCRSEQDERVVNLYLTQDGKRCVCHINDKIQNCYEKEWNRYNEKDKEIILHGLIKLNQFFEAISSGRKNRHES